MPFCTPVAGGLESLPLCARVLAVFWVTASVVHSIEFLFVCGLRFDGIGVGHLGRLRGLVFVFSFLCLFLACGSGETQPAASSSAPSVDVPEAKPAPSSWKPIPIRVGWQETWATQGQLAVILQQSEILSGLGFAPTFVGFSYGAPLN